MNICDILITSVIGSYDLNSRLISQKTEINKQQFNFLIIQIEEQWKYGNDYDEYGDLSLETSDIILTAKTGQGSPKGTFCHGRKQCIKLMHILCPHFIDERNWVLDEQQGNLFLDMWDIWIVAKGSETEHLNKAMSCTTNDQCRILMSKMCVQF